MPYKLNISEKGKAWKLETEADALAGKSLGDKFDGKEIKKELDGYELEITGGTDFAGFPLSKNVEGITLKKVLLKKGFGMHKRPRKGGKKKVATPRGLRLRKTLRGKTISDKTTQINIKVLKPGKTSLKEIFPEQNQPKQKETAQKAEQVPAQ